jgi:hypothetical protein
MIIKLAQNVHEKIMKEFGFNIKPKHFEGMGELDTVEYAMSLDKRKLQHSIKNLKNYKKECGI